MRVHEGFQSLEGRDMSKRRTPEVATGFAVLKGACAQVLGLNETMDMSFTDKVTGKLCYFYETAEEGISQSLVDQIQEKCDSIVSKKVAVVTKDVSTQEAAELKVVGTSVCMIENWGAISSDGKEYLSNTGDLKFVKITKAKYRASKKEATLEFQVDDPPTKEAKKGDDKKKDKGAKEAPKKVAVSVDSTVESILASVMGALDVEGEGKLVKEKGDALKKRLQQAVRRDIITLQNTAYCNGMNAKVGELRPSYG